MYALLAYHVQTEYSGQEGRFPFKETYRGVTKLAPPTAKPTIPLPTIILHTVVDSACQIAPIINKISATIIIRFRPSLSARTPATGLAMSAEKLVQDVIKLLSSTVRGRWERSEPIDTRVEEITPVL